MKRRVVVCDCETDPFRAYRVPHPFVWGFYDGETYHQFPKHPRDCETASKQFIDFLREQYVICYAHNGGKFDWHFILPEVDPYSDIMIINGRIARMNVGAAECRDSYNILPVPLKAYKKDEIDYELMEKENRAKPENWRKISEYLKSDCVYLYELIHKFVTTYGVQLTQASAAMNQWKTISQRELPRTDKKFYEFLAPYYCGGRVQCFESGIIDTRFKVYDINSAYPFAMLHLHPYSENYSHLEKFVPDADFYKVECVSRGAFPYRGLGDDGHGGFGLRFPSDNKRRVYHVTKWEYQAALDTETISRPKVLESITFNGHVDFKGYIKYFYDIRLQAKEKGDDATSLFAKLLMNSLYGKFASNPEHYRNYMVVPMDVIAGLEPLGWAFCGELGPWGLAEAPLDEKQTHYYNVATGASITGFVRAMLWRAICASQGVMYCDTDSVAVRERGAAVKLSDDLGDWKLEGEFDRAGIAGKKLYIMRGAPGWWKNKAGHTIQAVRCPPGGERLYKTASKGAKLTHAQLWEVTQGEIVNYVPEVPTFSAKKAPVFTPRRIKFTA
jgi:hypothetical protein